MEKVSSWNLRKMKTVAPIGNMTTKGLKYMSSAGGGIVHRLKKSRTESTNINITFWKILISENVVSCFVAFTKKALIFKVAQESIFGL